MSSRSGFTRLVGMELFRCRADSDDIYRHVRDVPYGEYVDEGQSFSVRIRRVRGSSPNLDVEGLETRIGCVILGAVEGLRVRLENPDKAFFGVLTDGNFVFGLKEVELSPKPMLERRPRRRPFFHPSSLMPKLARCMVNLARPRRGDSVLDPFCGTGSLLIEAGLMGMKALGSDIKGHMALGSLR
ncbi:MAG: DNA methyltransferase, partial [Candidatus Bathyarchaeia archaeon]